MPPTPETTTMSAARPWSLLKFGDDIWLKVLGTARLVSLRGTEITALPTPVEEVDARHGPFEYLDCTKSPSPEKGNLEFVESLIKELLRKGDQAQWVLDNIRTALGLTEVADGSSVLHTIGKLLEEHDEVVGLRTLMTNRVEEIQRLREEIRRREEGGTLGHEAEIERLRNALLRRELNHLAEIERLRNALLAKEETIRAIDLDRQTEQQRADKLAVENTGLQNALRATESDLASRSKQVEMLASKLADLRDDHGALARVNVRMRDALRKLIEEA